MTEQNAAIHSPRTRRPGIAAAVLAAGVAVALLAAWQWTARAYELTRGSSSDGTGGVEHVTNGVWETWLPLHPAKTNPLTFSVRNSGPVPITVTAVGGDSSIYGVEEAVMLVEPTMPCCLPEHGVPFSPVDLPVGKELTLFLTIRPVAQQPCTLARVGSIQVRFSVLGVDREQRMPLGPVVVFDNTGPDCGGVTYTVSEP
ncbi:hypothetical protein ACFQZ4_34865 [Catellatospora coxensis]|nr:hypothetical protein [Catellatospora coxensis]